MRARQASIAASSAGTDRLRLAHAWVPGRAANWSSSGPKRQSGRRIAGRLDGILGPPGVQAALERLGALEAELAELQRRPGAGLLPRSGAVQDKGLVAETVGRPLGNLIGQDADAAGDTDAVAVVL